MIVGGCIDKRVPYGVKQDILPKANDTTLAQYNTTVSVRSFFVHETKRIDNG